MQHLQTAAKEIVAGRKIGKHGLCCIAIKPEADHRQFEPLEASGSDELHESA